MAQASICIASQQDAQAVAEFVRANPDGQIHHTWQGCRVPQAASGGRWQGELAIAKVAGQIVGVMPMAFMKLWLLPVAMCRSDGGPITAGEDRVELVEQMLQWLVAYARRRHCGRVELRLPIARRVGQSVSPSSALYESALATAGFEPREPILFGTYWVKLGEDDEALLASMSSKCRRDVRKALREGVTVDFSNDRARLDLFRRNIHEMFSRKGLPEPSEEFFTGGVWPCMEAGLATVFAASYGGEIRNMAIVTLTGRATYWLGAIAPAGMEKGAPPTGQALHFGVMRHLRELGRSVYDLGGSPGPVPQKEHPNYGVWTFKHEFGGDWVDYLDQYQRVMNPAADKALSGAQRIFRAIRGFRRG